MGIALIAGLLASCSLLVDTTGLSGGAGEDDGATDGGKTSDTGAAKPLDAATSDGPRSDSDASNGCKGTAGPAMVRVTPGACIDATEVSRAQYATFLAAMGGSPLPGLPAACAYKKGHTPAAWPPQPNETSLPVTTVDWCDAWAYCHWADKALCGAVGGGPVGGDRRADPEADLWYRACSNGGERVYPWGPSFETKRCNGPSGSGEGSLVAVGSLPGCVGGLPGLFDMAGNVQEWVDSCDGDQSGSGCADRGGAFVHHDAVPTEDVRLQCEHRDVTKRSAQADNNGIRCCSYQ